MFQYNLHPKKEAPCADKSNAPQESAEQPLALASPELNEVPPAPLLDLLHRLRDGSKEDSLKKQPLPDETSKRDAWVTSQELRDELQNFTCYAFRNELAELRCQIRQDVRLLLRLGETADSLRGITTGPVSLRAAAAVRPPEAQSLAPHSPSGSPPALWAKTLQPPSQLQRPSSPRTATTENVLKLNHCTPMSSSDARSRDSSKSFQQVYRGSIVGQVGNPEMSSRNSEQGKKLNKGVLSASRFFADLAKPDEERRLAPAPVLKKKSAASMTRATSKYLQSKGTAGGGIFSKACVVLGRFFETGISLFIILNGAFIGAQAEYQASHLTESVPGVFPVMEVICCIVFTSELILNIIVHRRSFFFGRAWKWNLFDILLVVTQLIEVIGMVVAEQTNDRGTLVGNVSFIRLMRILRLVRVLRLVRLLQILGGLSTIISAIANSFKPLLWTVFLLLMVVYIFGILCTQIVFTHRLGLTEDSEELNLWWGSVTRSVLTLFQSIMGGVDWGTAVEPMIREISPWLAVMFAGWIAFVLLAVMNVITGTFVQSALMDAEKESTKTFRAAAKETFLQGGEQDEDQMITFATYESKLDSLPFSAWMSHQHIDSGDAKLLFRLLDKGQSGYVDAAKLVHGLTRLQEGAKYMDIMKVIFETEKRSRGVEVALQEGMMLHPATVSEISARVSEKLSAFMPASRHRDTFHIPGDLRPV